MPLPEYENLTQSELEMADHFAEIGDMSALREYQRISAKRGGYKAQDYPEYNQPMRPRRI